MNRKSNAIRLVVLVLVVVALIAGCGATALAPREHTVAQNAPAMEADYGKSDGTAGTEAGTPNGDTPAADRMIVWTADISLTVKDAQEAMDQVQAMARQLGGYTVSSESWLSDDQLNARLTIRVPAAKFEEAMSKLRALGIKVNHESAASDDVTDDYVDLESRLRALEAKEAQLLKFLNEAEDTEAVLAVYEQLSAAQTEIEQVKGRMAYLEKLSAMATIVAELWPEAAEPPVVEEGWKPLTILKDAARALVSTLQGLGNALIWVVAYVVPVLALVALPVALVWWLVRRLRRRLRRA
ncbi:MAG TPA: DUF4349 domain-containing protein [Anaerolineae bacterium]|nr:DUF4349 domain-containing protein [Anaerolineae bacterium]